MSGKFMKIKKIIIPTITLAIMVSCLSGCSCSSQSELHKMIERGEVIEIEVAEPNFTEQGTESKLTWVSLGSNTEDDDFRKAFELLLGITNENGIKNGIAYINLEGKIEQNNTLYNAFMNKNFVDSYWNNEEVQQAVKIAVAEHYADVDSDSDSAKYSALYLYWSLLPDYEPNYANMGASLTRAEAMTFLMRATTQVTADGKPVSNADFKALVGESDYTDYASYLDSKAFINTSDKSLNNQTFNGTMTRGEFIYILINNTFGTDAINNVDTSSTKLNDCKDGGSKIEAQKFGEGDYSTSYELVYALQNPDLGAPTPIYKALVKAKQLDIISAETAWDEALTREDAAELFVETMLAYSNLNGYKIESEAGVSQGESYRELAKNKFNDIKDTLTCDEATYVSEYIKFIDSGKTVEEVEKILYEKYENTENNGSGQKVEIPTVTPNEQVEQMEKIVTDEIKDEAFSGNFETWFQTRDGVFIYKQSPGVIYYWGSDMSVIDWENPTDTNRLIPTEELVSISTGTEVETSITSGITSDANSNTSSTEETETSSKPTFEQGDIVIDPNGKGDPSLWEGIIFNP